jgi:hypothetical protein
MSKAQLPTAAIWNVYNPGEMYDCPVWADDWMNVRFDAVAEKNEPVFAQRKTA